MARVIHPDNHVSFSNAYGGEVAPPIGTPGRLEVISIQISRVQTRNPDTLSSVCLRHDVLAVHFENHPRDLALNNLSKLELLGHNNYWQSRAPSP